MRKRLSMGAVVLASFAVAACVGDPSTTPVADAAADVAPPGDAAASDASSDASDGGANADADADARLVCKPSTSNFSCQNQVSCITLNQNSSTCRTTSCMGGEQLWQCFSPKNCTNMACCVSGAAPTGVNATSCTGGTLDVANATVGGTCKASCGSDTQLCWNNADCGATGTCVPVTVTGGTGTALKSLGVCAK